MPMFYDYKNPKKGLYEEAQRPLKPIFEKMAKRISTKNASSEEERAKDIRYSSMLWLSEKLGKKE